MHKLGIVFIVLIALAAAGASLLTAKLFHVRNSWARAAEQLEADIAENKTQIAARQRELNQLESQLQQVMIGWDRYWNERPTVPGPAQGQLTVNNLGFNHGLGGPDLQNRQETPEVHVFRPNADGASTYVGPFVTVPEQIFDNRAILTPTWPLRPSDAQRFGQGEMRHRALIPTGYKKTVLGLHEKLALADESLAEKQRDLVKMTELDQRAVDQLGFRRSELEAALNDVRGAEAERAEELARLHVLRLELQDAHNRMQTLIAQAKELEQRLPHPPSESEGTPITQLGGE